MAFMKRRFLLWESIALLTCCGCSSMTFEHFSVDNPPLDEVAVKRMAEQKEQQDGATPETARNVFAPTFVSDEEDKYVDAMEIYESSPAVPTGVYHHDGLVFVVVTIDTARESVQYLEGTALLRVRAQLQNEYPSLPRNFNLRSKVVEKELDDDTGVYRYAVVFRQSDIRKLIEQNKQH